MARTLNLFALLCLCTCALALPFGKKDAAFSPQTFLTGKWNLTVGPAGSLTEDGRRLYVELAPQKVEDSAVFLAGHYYFIEAAEPVEAPEPVEGEEPVEVAAPADLHLDFHYLRVDFGGLKGEVAMISALAAEEPAADIPAEEKPAFPEAEAMVLISTLEFTASSKSLSVARSDEATVFALGRSAVEAILLAEDGSAFALSGAKTQERQPPSMVQRLLSPALMLVSMVFRSKNQPSPQQLAAQARAASGEETAEETAEGESAPAATTESESVADTTQE
jgi:hypothetical protein